MLGASQVLVEMVQTMVAQEVVQPNHQIHRDPILPVVEREMLVVREYLMRAAVNLLHKMVSVV